MGAFKVPAPPSSFFEAVLAAFEKCDCGKCDEAKVDCPHADHEPPSQHARRMTAHEPDCSCSILCVCIWPEELAAANESVAQRLSRVSEAGKKLQNLNTNFPPIGPVPSPPMFAPLGTTLTPAKPMPDAAPPSDDADEYPSPVTMSKPKRRPTHVGPPTDHTSPRAAFRTGGR